MFPVHDWQFWVVTLIVVSLVWSLLRQIRPRTARSTRVSLTVGKTGEPDSRG